MPFQCLVCSGAALRIVEGFPALPRVTSDAKPFPAGGRLSACTNCGTIQKLPDQTFLDEIDRIYSSYSLYELAEGAEQVIFVDGAPRRRSEILVDLLDVHAKLDTIIDIGCGNGAALRTLARKLPEAKLWGSELSDRNEASLRKIANFQALFTIAIRDIPLRFDALTIIHVLEHVLEPVRFLSDCAGLLQPAGSMLVDVPDVETSPFDLIIADHLTHFSAKTLGYALSRAALRPSLLSNKVVQKEVTALVGRGAPLAEEKMLEEDFGADGSGLQRAQSIVGWLTSVLAHARATPSDRPIGIFGTSMAGMWLYGAMKERVSFFVDEDETKVGNQVEGRAILHPTNVPSDTRVLVPLALPVAHHIAGRWGSAERDYVALGSDSAMSFLGGQNG